MSSSFPTALALAAPILSTAPAAEASDAALNKKLASGDIIVQSMKVKGASLPLFTVMGVVDAPVETVWKLVTDCDGYVGMMPRVEDSKVVRRKGKTTTCQVRVDLPFPLGHLDSTTKNTQMKAEAGSRRMAWKMVKGDYKRNQGDWELTHFGSKGSGKTLIVYNALVVPKLAVPNSMLKSGQKRELPAVIKGIRKAATKKKGS